MGFPSEKELKKVRKKLEKAKPSYMLPENPTLAEGIKYTLCKKFVIYILKNNISQIQLAKKLKIDPARVSEIVRYRIDLYTIDKLIELAERLELDLKSKVA